LLDRDPAPTAIFASNDDMAAAAVSVAHRRHMDVPRQLTVVGFDDTIPAVTLWPPLTTVHQPVRKLAADALALLAAHVSKSPEKEGQPRERLLPYTIVHRSSAAGPLAADVSGRGATPS
jgi:LacI family transcriptional regulator